MAPQHVLVVDDDADFRGALVKFLERAGFPVLEAGNGAAALDRLHENHVGDHVGLILLDLSMPVMDGRRFRAEQLRDPSVAAVPVVVVSGDTAVPREAALLHAADHLTKPIDLDRLLTIVRRFC